MVEVGDDGLATMGGVAVAEATNGFATPWYVNTTALWRMSLQRVGLTAKLTPVLRLLFREARQDATKGTQRCDSAAGFSVRSIHRSARPTNW